ncbi:MAG: hypothetical protein IT378_22800 [Sandaracinaceae bacterium]|nr:hypothetical protein [Sandaracinaceae bacterium]
MTRLGRSLCLVLLVFGASSCSSDGICTDVAVATGGAHTDIGLGQCWDGQDRRVVCDPTGVGTAVTCTCSVAGNTGATFPRTEPLIVTASPTAAELAPINSGCRWALRPR